MAILARISDQIALTIEDWKQGFTKKGAEGLSSYLDQMLVCFLDTHTRDEALLSLVESLAHARQLKDPSSFYRAVIEREKIVSTGVGQGVAIPHAKLSGCDRFFIAVGIQQGIGLDWGALDGAPVRLIFLIGGPDDRPTEYLNLLSGLTFAAKDEHRRRQLFQAQHPQEVVDLFKSASVLNS